MNHQPEDEALPTAAALAAGDNSHAVSPTDAVPATDADGLMHHDALDGDQVEALTRMATSPPWEHCLSTRQLLQHLADGNSEAEAELDQSYQGQLTTPAE